MIVLFGMIIKHKSLKRKINVTFDFCCEISKTCKIRKTCEEQYQGNEYLSFRLGRVIHHSSGSMWCVFFFKRGWEKEKDRVRERSYLFFTVKLNFFTKCWFSLSKFVNNIRVTFGSKLQWSIQTKYYIKKIRAIYADQINLTFCCRPWQGISFQYRKRHISPVVLLFE